MWTHDFGAVAYAKGGRGPAYDCLGLFLHLQRLRHGRDLPDPACDMETAAAHPAVASARSDWPEITDPQEGDAALFRMGRHGLHIGYMVDATHMLHIESHTGVRVEPIRCLRWASRLIGVYRHA